MSEGRQNPSWESATQRSWRRPSSSKLATEAKKPSSAGLGWVVCAAACCALGARRFSCPLPGALRARLASMNEAFLCLLPFTSLLGFVGAFASCALAGARLGWPVFCPRSAVLAAWRRDAYSTWRLELFSKIKPPDMWSLLQGSNQTIFTIAFERKPLHKYARALASIRINYKVIPLTMHAGAPTSPSHLGAKPDT